MKKSSFIAVVLAVVMLYSCAGAQKDKADSVDGSKSHQVQKEDYKVPPQLLVEVLQSVKSLQKELPQPAGQNLKITHVSYDAQTTAICFRYDYTTEGYEEPTPEKLNELKSMVIASIREMPQELEFLRNGISMKYSYYTPKGKLLFILDITPEDVLE